MKVSIYAFILSLLSSFGFSQVSMLTNLPPVIAPNSTLSIEVKIAKGGVSNFSKYQMDVPPGVTVADVNSRTGNFTFEAGRAKIVWVSIPSDPEFIITFNMMTGSASGPGVFNQKFFYLENGTKQEIEAEPVNVNFDAAGAAVAVSFSGGGNAPANTNSNSNPTTSSTPSVAVNTSTTAEPAASPTTVPEKPVAAVTKTVEPVETPSVAPETKTTAVVETPTVAPEVKTVTEVAKNEPAAREATPPPVKPTTAAAVTNSENIVYKVQVGAYGSSPDKNRFKAIGKVNISQEGGLYKALVGNFATKEEALQKRQDLIGKGFDGFVVAYKNGVRIR